MDPIEQAVFTSAETGRAGGYQVVAASPGIGEADLRELAAWGPSHGSLLDSGSNGASLNFHPLPSGAHCVSRTTPAGWEYSGRGGVRVYTHCLVVPVRVAARFAHNPFALWRAAVANGSVQVCREVPRRLEAIQLPGRAAAVDTALLAQLCVNPGAEWMAALVQAAVTSVTLAIVGDLPAEQVIAGLINCLPLDCRPAFSFSTGLTFSSRRPFRVVALSSDRQEQRRVERLYNVAVLDLSREAPAESTPAESWSGFIRRALSPGRLSFLAGRLARQSAGITLADLPAFGLQMLEEMDASALGEAPPEDAVAAEAGGPLKTAPGPDVQEDEEPVEAEGGPAAARPTVRDGRGGRWTVAHGPRRASPVQTTAARRGRTPQSGHLDLDNREVLEKLERLDDLVFGAIAGQTPALEELKELWPQLREELGAPLLDESREHYLSHALSAWERAAQGQRPRDPAAAVYLLEILATLFG
jgi:hypothetical protein